MAEEETIICPKCGAESGDDWSRCGGVCPMPGSPHYKFIAAAVASASEVTSEKTPPARICPVCGGVRGLRGDEKPGEQLCLSADGCLRELLREAT